MGLLRNIIGGGYAGGAEIEQNFCEYSEIFGKRPALISCDLNFADLLPNYGISCCLKLQMDVYIQESLPTLISESEASYIAMVRSAVSEHIGGRFVGQGIIGSSGTAFLMFYIPERSAATSKRMLSEVFMGSFRHVEMDVVSDPEGKQYYKYLYPNELQRKKSNNVKILKQLRTYGDDGSTPRPVMFNLVFPSKNSAMSFYSESMEKGFVYKNIVEEDPPEGMVLPRHKITIEKTIPFNIELLEMIDNYLLKLCAKYGGEYRSLETDIVD
ncbi:MAG: ribonuclease E inhibitor RraB [Clostridia bacterium]|nr:ribonuclease E inhibitor RraB [Clostridia bacterium]